MSAEKFAIDVRDLTKTFGKNVVVNHISIKVPYGKIFGFLGPNGSGKTTTIRMLCGLLTPDAGTGTCLGMDLRRDALRIRREVGYMTQRFSFWDDLTLRENLLFVANVYGMDHVRARVDGTLKKMGLTAQAGQLAGTLSGGWKQRLALAACIMHEPRLLLLDEPTAGVDPKARREFWDEIHALAAAGMTILVSTHYMDEAERCHEVIYIAYGDIMVRGTVADVVRASGLATWVVKADRVDELRRDLEKLPAVETATLFGSDLRVSGTDAAALERALAPYIAGGTGCRAERDEVSLEDAFIYFMNRKQREIR